MATATIPAAGTTAADTTAHLRGGTTSGHTVQKTAWMVTTGGIATGGRLTDTTPPPLTNATVLPTARLTALPTARLTARLAARLAATGPRTALVTTHPRDAVATPQTPTAATPPRRDRGARTTKSPTGSRLRGRSPPRLRSLASLSRTASSQNSQPWTA